MTRPLTSVFASLTHLQWVRTIHQSRQRLVMKQEEPVGFNQLYKNH